MSLVNDECIATTHQDASEASLALIEKIQTVLSVENGLTATIAKVQPWLRGSEVVLYRPRVRPIPESMEHADAILKVARNLSSRTSAPAGWSPAAPVIGFSTPSPMPHQLRGGALATLQLERTKNFLAEASKKRQKLLEQQQQQQQQEVAASRDGEKLEESSERTTNEASRPAKRRSSIPNAVPPKQPPISQQKRPLRPKQEVSMNLSDSDSSEDDMEE